MFANYDLPGDGDATRLLARRGNPGGQAAGHPAVQRPDLLHRRGDPRAALGPLQGRLRSATRAGRGTVEVERGLPMPGARVQDVVRLRGGLGDGTASNLPQPAITETPSGATAPSGS